MGDDERKRHRRRIVVASAIALAALAYPLIMGVEYLMGPSPEAAERLDTFRYDREHNGIEYRLASETWDDDGNVTYIFEAIDRDDLRIVIQPKFYPILEVEFAPAGFFHTYGPGWHYEVVNTYEWLSVFFEWDDPVTWPY